MTVRGILWDLDGVLSDTQAFHSWSESAALAEIGLAVDPDEIARHFAGSTDRPLFEGILKSRLGAFTAPEIDSLIARKKALLFGRMDREGVPWVPGARDLFDSFAATGLPMAVASSSTLEFISYVVEKLGIRTRLANLTSGHEVPKSKPEPAVFLLAAERLGITPDTALVFEDSAFGLEAARRAGMRSVALWPAPGQAPACTWATASWVGLDASTALAKVGGLA